MAKRGPAPPLPGQREPHHDRPPPPSLATYGPLTGQRGGLPLAKGTEGGPMATRELQPPTSRPPMAKGEPHPSLATHWPKGTGRGRLRPALPPTGHLRPTWPSEAFGHLRPYPTPADRGLRTGGSPTPRLASYWLRPALPTPQTFACIGGRSGVARVPYTPFGDPYPHRLTGGPLPATYGQRGATPPTGH